MKVVNNETEEANFFGGTYYVEIEYADMIIPVDISKLRNIKADEETMIAMQVWKNRHV